MIDILIPLGSGSKYDNIELRYCLRSIEKYISGYQDIYIIGERPEWIENVIYIPAKDGAASTEKERNILNKILIGCQTRELSDDFLFFNDDHFILRSFQADRFPFYHQGPIDKANSKSAYRYTLSNTAAALQAKGLPTLNYDLHCPILYNKDRFKQSVAGFDWSKPWGYGIKSIYGNVNQPKSVFQPDLKINQRLSVSSIKSLISGKNFFSIGDAGLYINSMFEVFEELYPEKSKYER